MATRFVYFDLGNVLLNFDHRRGARQMAEVAGVSEEQVWETVFAADFQSRFEAGAISGDEFFDEFCRTTKTTPDRNALMFAAGAIFELNTAIVPVVAQLQSAGYRTGVLSNTCEWHWQYCIDGRYAMLPGAFEQVVLSYEARSMKPDAEVYRVAIEAAGVAPNEIFFVDDRADNVAGAVAAGIDAVLFTSASQCAAELKRRGLEFNY
jgi:putative hydrolase of the HAD superfamily